MPTPKVPFSQRARARAQKMREGTKRIAMRAWGGTKKGGLKIKEWSVKGASAMKRVAKNRTVRRAATVVAVVAVLGIAADRWTRRPISNNEMRFLNRPTIEYVEHLRNENKGTMFTEIVSVLAGRTMDPETALRSGLDKNEINEMSKTGHGRAMLWKRILQNARAATDNPQFSYTWGTQGKVVGKGKDGFEKLDVDNQLATQLYWAIHGTLLVRSSTDNLGNPIQLVDVGRMHTPFVNSMLRYGAYFKGKATEAQLQDIMNGKNPDVLIQEKGW